MKKESLDENRTPYLQQKLVRKAKKLMANSKMQKVGINRLA